MDQEIKEALIERWLYDDGFRHMLRKDPEGWIERLGVSLSEEEKTALRKVDWSLSDEELSQKCSKTFFI